MAFNCKINYIFVNIIILQKRVIIKIKDDGIYERLKKYKSG